MTSGRGFSFLRSCRFCIPLLGEILHLLFHSREKRIIFLRGGCIVGGMLFSSFADTRREKEDAEKWAARQQDRRRKREVSTRESAILAGGNETRFLRRNGRTDGRADGRTDGGATAAATAAEVSTNVQKVVSPLESNSPLSNMPGPDGWRVEPQQQDQWSVAGSQAGRRGSERASGGHANRWRKSEWCYNYRVCK